MKHFFTREPISKYEVQIKSGILVIALLLFIYASRNSLTYTRAIQENHGLTNTK